uniref:Uncharacterized protein n=1 Tax=Anopheles minimus TaxID=112268 RepID=A0A182WNC2_9DIPT
DSLRCVAIYNRFRREQTVLLRTRTKTHGVISAVMTSSQTPLHTVSAQCLVCRLLPNAFDI